jgi:hypothetical protein
MANDITNKQQIQEESYGMVDKRNKARIKRRKTKS